MNKVTTLRNLLESFDFASVNSAETSSAIDAVVQFLNKAESHLASIVASPTSSPRPATISESGKTVTSLTAASPTKDRTCSPTSPGTPHPIASQVDYKHLFLEEPLLKKLNDELKSIKFTRASTISNSPQIALFGDSPYVFNSASRKVKPSPINQSSTLFRVLDTVNSKLGFSFNSILINKYLNKNVSLGWHQDNEPIVDKSTPIASLSIGCARRFQITDNKDDWMANQWLEQCLHDNSIFVMKPGLQTTHYHRIDRGAEEADPTERGTRYSLTFRRLQKPVSPTLPPHTVKLPASQALRPPPVPKALVQQPPASLLSSQQQPTSDQPVLPAPTETQPVPSSGNQRPSQERNNEGHVNSHSNCVNTLVFGSSLTKGLDSDILSRRGKTFKVFTKGGARVETVVRMVRDAVANKEVCTSCVQSVFLVVGGNDAQNIRSEKGLKKFESSYKKLIELINSKFPVIRINVVSLVPRRTTNYWHVQRVFHINDFLYNLCSNENSNIFFLPVFTKFLVKKDLYYHSGQVIMSSKLFLKDGIHFTRIGDSVLAKTLIAVANDPHYS